MSRRLFAGLAAALMLAGCATITPAPPTVDVTGRWTGAWSGHGVLLIPRDEDVTLDLTQAGASGTGLLLMHGTLVAEAVPETIRSAAMTGVRVVFDVSGDTVRLAHELGSELFDAEMVVSGDHMLGRVLGSDPEVRFDLTRAPRAAAGASVATAPPPPPPPPPPAPASPPVGAPPTGAGPASVLPPPAAPLTSLRPPPAAPPARAMPPVTDFVPTAELRPIHFDFDSAEIRAADVAILDANAAWLRAHPDQLVLIEAHCDERGTPEYNLALGERRARAAMLSLLERGLAAARVITLSYGLERPECSEPAEACWARNRRAVFLVRPH